MNTGHDQPRIASKAPRTAGTRSRKLDTVPMAAMVTAAKGRDCGSRAANAAVPRPCALAACTTPRDTSSLKLNESISRWPTAAPRSPVAHTIAAVRGAAPPSRSHMGSASATVMDRGRREDAISGERPTKRARAAVAKREKREEARTVPKISSACRCTTRRCKKTRWPSQRTTRTSIAIRMLPAPMLPVPCTEAHQPCDRTLARCSSLSHGCPESSNAGDHEVPRRAPAAETWKEHRDNPAL